MENRNVTPLPFSVGLTGGIGCGKSTVATMFAEHGATVIDTDLIAHEMTSADGPAITAIRTEFGGGYILADGTMNRGKMRDLVFSDAGAKNRLENILHPLIQANAEIIATQAKGCYVIFVVPLLIESGNWKQRVSRVLTVDCCEESQVLRVSKRSSLEEAQIRAIMATQTPRSVRLALSDDVVNNDDNIGALGAQVEHLHGLYSALAKQTQ